MPSSVYRLEDIINKNNLKKEERVFILRRLRMIVKSLGEDHPKRRNRNIALTKSEDSR